MRFLNIVYSFLFIYIIAAILFWGHTLDKQNEVIYKSELRALNSEIDSVNQFNLYKERKAEIKNNLNARKRQYSGEGATFLLVILIGAGIVYSTVRNRNKLAKQQTNFILSITHELKSPIAAVKLNMETLQRPKLKPEMQAKLVERSVIEANRLDDLCNNLLLASRMEDRHFQFNSVRINLSKLVTEVSEMMEVRKKVKFHKEIEEESFCEGDPLLWKLVVSNLLENSVKYGQSDQPISILLNQTEEEILLSIQDHGPGISDREKSNVFKKFYRVGNENSRTTKGTGLGLYLTAKIISEFKGTIAIRDNNPTGAIFDITVPLNN